MWFSRLGGALLLTTRPLDNTGFQRDPVGKKQVEPQNHIIVYYDIQEHNPTEIVVTGEILSLLGRDHMLDFLGSNPDQIRSRFHLYHLLLHVHD